MNPTAFECQDSGMIADEPYSRLEEDTIITKALAILHRRTDRASYQLATTPNDVKQLLMLAYGEAENEHFGALWLDMAQRIIKRDILSIGTLASCSVYPREVVKAGLAVNGACCILFHNHPSGKAEPSDADRILTRTINQALDLVGMRVLDHLVVTGNATYSFAEHGDL